MREPIVTRRLMLRDIVPADAETLCELDSDPEVMRFIGPVVTPDVDAVRQRIESVYVPWQRHPWHGIWLVHDRATAEFLGWVFIRPAHLHPLADGIGWTREDEVEIGYRYHRAAWGRGIATEAALPLLEAALADAETSGVVGCALADNEASLRVLEKLGLQRVGEISLPGTGERTIKMARPCPGSMPWDPT
jgi:RimJ/RimL family protein N-acetyltransferase